MALGRSQGKRLLCWGGPKENATGNGPPATGFLSGGAKKAEAAQPAAARPAFAPFGPIRLKGHSLRTHQGSSAIARDVGSPGRDAALKEAAAHGWWGRTRIGAGQGNH